MSFHTSLQVDPGADFRFRRNGDRLEVLVTNEREEASVVIEMGAVEFTRLLQALQGGPLDY